MTSFLANGQRLTPGTVVFKVKENTGNIEKVTSEIPDIKVIPFNQPNGNSRAASSILDRIYMVQSDKKDKQEILRLLQTDQKIEYACIIPQERILHVPDDPQAHPDTGGQSSLSVIKAYDAWGITTGNPDIIISINDTGMDIDHEDLTGNYYINAGEELDGLDNDGNGYVDDLIGYDFADNDNNPNADTDVNSTLNHGTHVGGVAGAKTNNGIGIAGIAYDSKIAPHKGFTTVGTVSTGTWEGLLYAADNGYDVANLSWGNTAGFSQFFQDIIDYCVLEKDLVIVAAAGNTNADLDFYPASYNHVLSVGASTHADIRWSSGTFGHHVDVMAPGVGILSTQKDNTYNSDNGSSHASPMVAGTAALVKSVFPDYNAQQIMEQIRATTDDIYALNPGYTYKLGKGRLNVYRAVSENLVKSLRADNISYNNGFGQYAFAGDTVIISLNAINYLAPLENVSISLICENPQVSVLNGDIQFGQMATLENRSDLEFKILLDPFFPINTEIDFRLEMADGDYEDFQNFSFRTEPNNLTLSTPHSTLSFFGNGNIGFDQSNYSEGQALMFRNIPVLNYAGLMVGTGTTDLRDNVINSYSNPRTRDTDFASHKPISLSRRDSIDFLTESQMSTSDGEYLIEQKVVRGTLQDYFVVQYRVVNTSESVLQNVQAGFFADYFLGDQSANHAVWDQDLNALIMYDDNQTRFAALGISDNDYTRVALDMQSQNGNLADIDNTFSDDEKFGFLTGGNIDDAGALGAGNDVALMVGKNLGDIESRTGTKVSFILALGDSYTDLSETLQSANQVAHFLDTQPKVTSRIQACLDRELTINPGDEFYSFYRDAQGSDLILTGSELTIPTLNQDTSIFLVTHGTYDSEVEEIKIRAIDKVADFTASSDTLYLDNALNSVTFLDQSTQPLTWDWDFGNGLKSSLPNPTVYFDTPGVYSVSLTITSKLGCEDQHQSNVVVANRPASPNLEGITVCRNEAIHLNHPTSAYAIFDKDESISLSGPNLELGPFESDTILQVAQYENGFISLAADFIVNIDPLRAEFNIYPDTLSEETAALFIFDGQGASDYQWTINDQVLSTSASLSVPVSGALDLELQVSNDDCTDMVSQIINFASSPLPLAESLTICPGESALIQPVNGEYFGFYSDQALTDLLHKGRQFRTDILNESTAIWVAGLDSILPGTATEVSIQVSDFEAEIFADPARLDLSQSSTVRLTSPPETVSAAWYVDDQLVETILNPVLFFSDSGFYKIRLVAWDQNGCPSESEISYEVFLPEIPILGVIDKELLVYPNPSLGLIFFRSKEPIIGVKLFDLSGQLIRKFQDDTITSIETEMESGLYLLEISTKNSSIMHRIRIQ